LLRLSQNFSFWENKPGLSGKAAFRTLPLQKYGPQAKKLQEPAKSSRVLQVTLL
jgi:hypothetical protein